MTSENGWNERTAEFYEFKEPGDVLEGVLMGIDLVEIEGRPVHRYTVKTPDKTLAFLGGVQLESMLKEDDVTSEVRVQFTGTVTTKQGREVKQFRVWTK